VGTWVHGGYTSGYIKNIMYKLQMRNCTRIPTKKRNFPCRGVTRACINRIRARHLPQIGASDLVGTVGTVGTEGKKPRKSGLFPVPTSVPTRVPTGCFTYPLKPKMVTKTSWDMLRDIKSEAV